MPLWSRLPTFDRGVHPDDAKATTRDRPIRQFPFAPVLTVPFAQHLGKPAIPIVGVGAVVVRGAQIARPDGAMSVAYHAPVSGKVRHVGLVPAPGGRMVPGIHLETAPGSTQEVCEGSPVGHDASPAEILAAIRDAGIVGLGGAAFPTHVKLEPPAGTTIDTVIVNGVECEPYLSTDHRVMLEQAGDIALGIRYLLRVSGAPRAIVGVEANKPEVVAVLEAAIAREGVAASVALVAVKYPQGAEKMLIQALLGRVVPRGAFPAAVGALCINVATTAEIGRLLPHGRGIQERVITVAGPAILKPGNYRMPIGTPLRFVLETVGVTDNLSEVVLGGPMMGGAVATLDVPVVKGTSGVLALTTRERTSPAAALPCIRCADCVSACPMGLNPSELGRLARIGAWQRMAQELALFDCFECGACSFVCPSRIPLVEHFRVAKGNLRRSGVS